ncbi:MAG: hypothetical protein RLZZ335_487, partial [Bacteroidota bacterium]
WQYDSLQVIVSNLAPSVERNIRVLASGDINGSMQPNPWLRASFRSLQEQGTTQTNRGMRFPVRLEADLKQNLGAISLVLLLPEGLTLWDVRLPQAIASDMAPVFRQIGRTVRMAWYGLHGLTGSGGSATVELWLEGSAEGSISLSDESECADISGELMHGLVWSAPRLVKESSSASIFVYPNPATDRIWIGGIPGFGSGFVSGFDSGTKQNQEAGTAGLSHSTDRGVWVKFYDLQGRLLTEGRPDGANSIALPNGPTGIIQVEVHSSLGQSRHKILVTQK